MLRAQMMAVVVNEMVVGGWLEFLGSVELAEDRATNEEVQFDIDGERSNMQLDQARAIDK